MGSASSAFSAAPAASCDKLKDVKKFGTKAIP